MGAYSLDDQYEDIEKAMKAILLAEVIRNNKI
jgi:hypothetical protein